MGALGGGKGRESLLGQLSLLPGDRAFRAALLFSLAVHGAVLLQWRTPPRSAAPARKRLMVATLLHLPPPGPALPDPVSQALPRQETVRPAPLPGVDDPAEEPEGGGGPPASAISARAAGVPGGVRRVPTTARLSGGEVRTSASVPPAGLRPSPAAASLAPPAASRAGGSDGVAEMLSEIRRRIERRKSYPLLARRNGWEGEVLVELRLDPEGTLEGVEVVSPSSYRLLDEATLSAVRKAGPFPPLPGRVRVPVLYRLE